MADKTSLKKTTPAMKQYFDMKEKYEDCIILFRMGDFYETFFEDAKVVAKELEITLTSRGKLIGGGKIPLAGIPYHALDNYLPKLVKKGYKVAICEQIEDPKKAKGIVKRDVVRVVTKGTITDLNMLDDKSNNYIVSISVDDLEYGLAICDISTGEFMSTQVDKRGLIDEISKLSPAEIIIPLSYEKTEFHKQFEDYYINLFDDRFFYIEKAKKTIKNFFAINNISVFGLKSASICASGALLSYLKETQKTDLIHIRKIRSYGVENFMSLDKAATTNLELVKSVAGYKGTLLAVLDYTKTSMGGRLLKKWILKPLISKQSIKNRLDGVDELFQNGLIRNSVLESLNKICDIERIISKISFRTANARDLLLLLSAIESIPNIKKSIANTSSDYLKILSKMDDLKDIKDILEKSINPEAPLSVREGKIIKTGYNKDVDELRDILSGGQKYLANLEVSEKERTKIRSLKIKFNKVLGYFIEISKTNKHLVPSDYILKQGQVNSERYITNELKEYEHKVLSAQEKNNQLEYELFMKILDELSANISRILKSAMSIAKIDVICSLATCAYNNDYTRPTITDDKKIIMHDSRHPVLELIEPDFIPNDVDFNNKSIVKLITGPNMAGKSTYMRQIALIVLMAQIGSFVPAKKATISIVDKIFTRVGAHDELIYGKSTFMVEMNETAYILNNATDRSLIVLDEIGRGTSTYDGVSIAWSVAEFIIKKIKAKTLFATHYHVMTKLEKMFDGITNYNITVKEKDDKIIFLRKIVRGGTNKSYGIQVAKLAGLPDEVILRSKEIMSNLEKEDSIRRKISKEKGIRPSDQMSLLDI